MNRPLIVLVAVLVLVGIGISVTNQDSGSDRDTLAEAMCDDLESGFSMFQMHAQAVSHYRDGRSEDAAQLAAAELEDLATRRHCPAFRDEFEATITYQQWIAPDE